MDIELYPRYLPHHLRTQMAATVVGKLVEYNPKRHSIILQTNPQAKMNVEVLVEQQNELKQFKQGLFYEVRGVCRSNKDMDMREYTCFGQDFDLQSYNAMLELSCKEFKSIFYP